MKSLSKILFGLAILALIFCVIGAFGYDLWLASTQWLLISIALSVYALYLKKV
jgi:hypothetical protein